MEELLKQQSGVTDGKVLYQLLLQNEIYDHTLKDCYRAFYKFHVNLKMIKFPSEQKGVIESFLKLKSEKEKRDLLKKHYPNSKSNQQLNYYKFSYITEQNNLLYYDKVYRIVFQDEIDDFLEKFISEHEVKNVNQLFGKIQELNILGISKQNMKKDNIVSLLNQQQKSKCVLKNARPLVFRFTQDNKLIDMDTNFPWQLKKTKNFHEKLLSIQNFCLEMSLIPTKIFFDNLNKERNVALIKEFNFFEKQKITFETSLEEQKKVLPTVVNKHSFSFKLQDIKKIGDNKYETDFITARNEYFTNAKSWSFIAKESISSVDLSDNNKDQKNMLYYY